MRKLFIAATALLLSLSTLAQTMAVSEETYRLRKEFQNRKFGIFLHWGIYSMMASGEWVQHSRRIDRNEYAQMANGFYPALFNAREWAQIFKEAGAQYVTFTTRHHDGFSMWETKASPYNIVEATPYGRDVLKSLASACAEQGLKLHLYYSHMDWYRDDYPLGKVSKDLPHDKSTTNWTSYYSFMNQQLTELLTNYGPIGAVWFDGMWDHPEEGFEWQLDEQYALIKKLQPRCLIGNNHHGSPRDFEDFQLFEQDLPGQNNAGFSGSQEVSNQVPLETCMTINNSWGYNITDTNYKSGDEVIRQLVGAAGRNANFLLNIGPRPDGQLPTQAVKVLEEVGRFMSRHSHTIYNTRGGIVPPQDWGVTTQDGHTLYIHILNKEKDGQIINEGLQHINGGALSIFLPLKGHSISNVSILNTGEKLSCQPDDGGYRIFLHKRPDTVDLILQAKVGTSGK